MEILITIFAGLGLFFTGIRLIGHNLKQMIGRRLRALVGKAVADNRSATLYGLAAGAVMQSVNAVIFLLSTLVSTDVITTRQALPLINWANLGTSMIVLLAGNHDPRDIDDLDVLRILTQCRSDLMDTVGIQRLSMRESLPPSNQRTMFACSTILEHSVWLVRRRALSLAAQAPVNG